MRANWNVGCCAILLVVVSRTIALSQQYSWMPAPGPYGVNVQTMIVSKQGTLFVGAGSGLFRSANEGLLWTRSAFPDTSVSLLVMDTSRALIAKTSAGFYRSSDDGQHWGALGWSSITSLACPSNGLLFATGTPGGIYRSTDQGGSWASWGLSSTKFEHVLCSSKGVLLAAGDNSGLYCGSINDTTWQKTAVDYSWSIKSLAELSDGTLLAGGLQYVWSSTDQGLTWTSTGPEEYDLFIECFLEVDSSNLLAGATPFYGSTHGGVYRSTDAGKTWSVIGLNEWPVYSLVPTQSGEIFAGTSRGVFGSNDYGASWNPYHTGLMSLGMLGLSVIDSSIVVVGTGNGIFRSTDGGGSWTDCRTAMMPATTHTFAMDQSGFLYSENQWYNEWAGVYRSQDSGKTWTNVSGATIPFYDDVGPALMVSRKGDLYEGAGNRFYRSTDHGMTWTSSKLPSYGLNTVVCDSANRIFGGYGGNGVIRSLDDGVTWVAVNTGLTTSTQKTIRRMAAKDTSWLFAVGSGGVFRSSNHGDSWSLVNSTVDARSITVAKNGDILVSFGNGNLLKSTNNGDAWAIASTGKVFNAFQFDQTGVLWGASDAGLYRVIGASQPVLSVTPTNRPVSGSAGSTSFTVSNTGTGSMSWTANSDQSWAIISSGNSGTNNGTIAVTYAANPSTTDSRTATITVTADGATGNPKHVTVTQAGAPMSAVQDLFPLRKGLDFAYIYRSTYHESYSSGHEEETDTGMVHCQIVDSVRIDDTTASWAVEEVVHLFIHQYGSSTYGMWAYDTTFWRDTTIVGTVTESLTGFHRIRCRMLVWLLDPTYWVQYAGDEAYRFSPDTTAVVRQYRWDLPAEHYNNSTFVAGRGMTERHYLYYNGGNTITRSQTDVWLVGSPVTSEHSLARTYPVHVELLQNYPNPFNPSTMIRYSLPNRSQVTLTVFNTLGQQITILQNGEQEAGYHEVQFDGAGLSSGVYFYRIQVGEFVATKRLLLLR